MTQPGSAHRIGSIDLLRGLIMIIMALDHTRDFFHVTAMTEDPLNPVTTTPTLFFTRWITHFCAPVFVFLSGLSAWLSSRKKPKGEASLFLIKRGAWLVIAELTLVNFGLSFNPFFNFIILQVIWAIGWSMIILGALMRLSWQVIFVTGLILFTAHNVLDYVNPGSSDTGRYIWGILFTSRGMVLPVNSDFFIGIFYAILPWTGIMLLGYSAGVWFQKDYPAEKRKRNLLVTGALLTALFIALRIARGYGDPGAWDGESFYSFLNTSKYPPSLQFACMTLGPALILLALFENTRGRWSQIISIYGKVPFFYYILHFYLIHTALVIAFFASGFTSAEISDRQTPFFFRPLNFGYSLWIVYLIWLAVVALLYFPCRWFHRYKTSHSQWWLKYL